MSLIVIHDSSDFIVEGACQSRVSLRHLRRRRSDKRQTRNAKLSRRKYFTASGYHNPAADSHAGDIPIPGIHIYLDLKLARPLHFVALFAQDSGARFNFYEAMFHQIKAEGSVSRAGRRILPNSGSRGEDPAMNAARFCHRFASECQHGLGTQLLNDGANRDPIDLNTLDGFSRCDGHYDYSNAVIDRFDWEV
jgi:hypothetical protein